MTDFVTVSQDSDPAFTAMADDGVADYFDQQVDAGLTPDRFGRVWIHTHPGDSPQPSGTDEATFSRVFGRCDWAVMLILARGGASYARLRFGVGPGGAIPLTADVDWSAECPAPDHAAWRAEYDLHVRVKSPHAASWADDLAADDLAADDGWTWGGNEWIHESELRAVDHFAPSDEWRAAYDQYAQGFDDE